MSRAVLALVLVVVVTHGSTDRSYQSDRRPSFTTNQAMLMFHRLRDGMYENGDNIADALNIRHALPVAKVMSRISNVAAGMANGTSLEHIEDRLEQQLNIVRALTRVVRSQQQQIYDLATGVGIESPSRVCIDPEFAHEPGHDAARDILAYTMKRLVDPDIAEMRAQQRRDAREEAERLARSRGQPTGGTRGTGGY